MTTPKKDNDSIVKEKHAMLNLLPTGEGEIIKRNRFGVYVKFPVERKAIFIYYSETLTEEGLFGTTQTETVLKDL